MLTHFLCSAEPWNKAASLASPSFFHAADHDRISLVEAVHMARVRLCGKEHGRAGCSHTSSLMDMSLQGWVPFPLVAIPHARGKGEEWEVIHWE